MDLKEVLAIALRCFILFGFYDTWNGKNIAARIAPVPQESTYELQPPLLLLWTYTKLLCM